MNGVRPRQSKGIDMPVGELEAERGATIASASGKARDFSRARLARDHNPTAQRIAAALSMPSAELVEDRRPPRGGPRDSGPI